MKKAREIRFCWHSRNATWLLIDLASRVGRVALLLSLTSLALFAQTVSLTNTTIGGSSLFYIGDSWEFDITGPPNTAVSYAYSGESPTNVGSTDSSGNLTITGSIYEGSEGCWDETWWVGASVASPDPVSFCVYPAGESSCSISTTGPVTLYNEDVWDPSFYFYYLNSPYIGAYISGASTQDWCPMYGTYVGDVYGSLSNSQYIFTSVLDEWYSYDNGYRPINPDGTDPSWFYPYLDEADYGFGAVNLTNLNYTWATSNVTLLVYWTLD